MTDEPVIYSFAELNKMAKQHERKLARQCFIRGKYLTLHVVYPYHIELSRIDTKDKLIEWIHHLSEKNWITPQLIRRIIDLVSKHFGFQVYVGA